MLCFSIILRILCYSPSVRLVRKFDQTYTQYMYTHTSGFIVPFV